MDKPVMQNISISRQKKLLILLVLCILGVLLYLNSMLIPIGKYCTSEVPQAKNYPKHRLKDKVILYWNTFFDEKDKLYLGEENIFENCSFSNCYATFNKSFLPIEQFDAVIFHAPRYSFSDDMVPRKRSIHQKYIFFSLESPYNTKVDDNTNHNFYNWTMTYRKDSDIHYPYGIVVKNVTNYEIPDDVKNKTKLIAWFVSNCETLGSKRRMKYAKELQKYIKVDTYGTCGDMVCENKNKCYEMLNKDYKFYLSFENSMCKDYVTEKLFNILHLNVVPIVLGIFDYTDISPPNSIINTNDFKNPKDLASYLYRLDLNWTEYSQYFEWKKFYTVENSREYTLCQICKKLNEPLTYSSYEDVSEWFFGFKCVL